MQRTWWPEAVTIIVTGPYCVTNILLKAGIALPRSHRRVTKIFGNFCTSIYCRFGYHIETITNDRPIPSVKHVKQNAKEYTSRCKHPYRLLPSPSWIVVTHSDLGNEYPFRYREVMAWCSQETSPYMNQDSVLCHYTASLGHSEFIPSCYLIRTGRIQIRSKLSQIWYSYSVHELFCVAKCDLAAASILISSDNVNQNLTAKHNKIFTLQITHTDETETIWPPFCRRRV